MDRIFCISSAMNACSHKNGRRIWSRIWFGNILYSSQQTQNMTCPCTNPEHGLPMYDPWEWLACDHHAVTCPCMITVCQTRQCTNLKHDLLTYDPLAWLAHVWSLNLKHKLFMYKPKAWLVHVQTKSMTCTCRNLEHDLPLHDPWTCVCTVFDCLSKTSQSMNTVHDLPMDKPCCFSNSWPWMILEHDMPYQHYCRAVKQLTASQLWKANAHI